MAKVEYLSLIPEEEALYFRTLTSYDRFNFARVGRKVVVYSVKRKAGLTQRSLLPQVAEAWNPLSAGVKDDWVAAGAVSNMKGYNLFVQDKVIRIKNDIAGNAVPSLIHQSWVGALTINSPATELQIIQPHPHTYYVQRPVPGFKGQKQAVLVQEDFAFPLTVGLSYASDLSAEGGDPFARFYARVWSSYQGVDEYADALIELDLSSAWQSDEVVLPAQRGYPFAYALYFHLHDVRGQVLIDNIRAEHSGQNWARDYRCVDINQGFTGNFYQIPKHWAAVILPEGAEYNSIYPPD